MKNQMTKQEIEAILEKIEASDFCNVFINRYIEECKLIRSAFLDNDFLDELTMVNRAELERLVKELDAEYTGFVQKLRAKDKAFEKLKKANAGLA